MSPIKLAVLDDHALIIEAIKAMVDEETEISFVGGFQNSTSFEEFLKTESLPHILLLDIQLKAEDGIKLCSHFKKKYPELKIIMLSSITQPAIIMDALKKGTTGYLPKNIGLNDLKEACTQVMEGKTYIHKDLSFIPPQEKTSQYQYLPRLTRREKEVLTLIMEELTTAEIAEKLCLTVSTVETHRASLFSKTDSKNVVGLIKYTLEKGLID